MYEVHIVCTWYKEVASCLVCCVCKSGVVAFFRVVLKGRGGNGGRFNFLVVV